MVRRSSGCVAQPREEHRATHVRRLGAAALLAITVLLTLSALAPTVAVAGTDPTSPPKCGREGDEPKRCVGPVTDESGGGGSTLTIVVSVVVGLAVAGVAFVLVRRQLASGGRRG